MLEGLTDNFSSVLRRESVSECDLEIVKRHLIALPINEAQQSACGLSDVITRLARTQRNQFCGKNKPQPLQPISDSLPTRPHCGVSITKSECLTPSPVMTTYTFYHPCPGLATGGKLLRNSFCCCSASFCCSASRACCSAVGPGLAQLNNAIRIVQIKSNLVSSFFILGWEQDDNQGEQCGNLSPEMFYESARRDYSTLVTSYSSIACSRYLCSSAFRRSRISFSASSFFKLT